uniref:hypothetical protein n=1 Tax=Vibrio coralliilyticus TaxID=190893 RepID=UPI00159EC0B3|nr:hypothetical protein [Vibrio coralliilyticus]
MFLKKPGLNNNYEVGDSISLGVFRIREIGPSDENTRAELGRNRRPTLSSVWRLAGLQLEVDKQSVP